MQNGDKALPKKKNDCRPASHKINSETVLTDTGMQNGDDASPSIRPSGRGQKTLINLEPHGIF